MLSFRQRLGLASGASTSGHPFLFFPIRTIHSTQVCWQKQTVPDVCITLCVWPCETRVLCLYPHWKRTGPCIVFFVW